MIRCYAVCKNPGAGKNGCEPSHPNIKKALGKYSAEGFFAVAAMPIAQRTTALSPKHNLIHCRV
jgi:hypothetical protein